jgi:hypothetical protein
VANPTNPAIRDAQNTERSLRLLGAQRRLYSDAKTIHNARIGFILLGSALSIAAGFLLPDARVLVGLSTSLTLILLSAWGGGREGRRVREAASVQEEFDTQLFQLTWNEMLVDRPTPTLIAEASQRYRGPSVRDWYADTQSVVRPLDVLICQRSNVGWGSSLHRLWAAILSTTIILCIPVIVALSWVIGMPLTETLAAIVAPLLAPAREALEMIRANRDAAQNKSALESKILVTWRKGLEGPSKVTPKDCRLIQDRILTTRQTNASVPDWLDRIRHKSQEGTMRLSAEHMIEESRTAGVA